MDPPPPPPPPLKFSLKSSELDYTGLIDKCITDIDKFKKAYINQSWPEDINGVIDNLNNKIKNLKNKTTIDPFVVIITDMNNNINNITVSGQTYLDKMHHAESIAEKYKLWIYRTYMFYALLSVATISFGNQPEFDKIYSNVNVPKIGQHKPEFIACSEVLLTYELGIFGSLTPTSDIDIGIQYAYNESLPEVKLLSYFVKHFENLFILYTGFRSLDFDIETYATLNVMNIDDGQGKQIPTFFLSSEKFEQTHFDQLLPVVMNSMVRNNFGWFTKNYGDGSILKNNADETFVDNILTDINARLKKIEWIDDPPPQVGMRIILIDITITNLKVTTLP